MSHARLPLLSGLLLLLAPHVLADDKRNVVEIDRLGEHNVTVGQTIHFIVRYDGFSGRVFTGLQVAIDGNKVENPTVESRPDPKLVDVGQVVFVYRAEKSGSYRVVVTPMTGQTKAPAREFILKVGEKK